MYRDEDIERLDKKGRVVAAGEFTASNARLLALEGISRHAAACYGNYLN